MDDDNEYVLVTSPRSEKASKKAKNASERHDFKVSRKPRKSKMNMLKLLLIKSLMLLIASGVLDNLLTNFVQMLVPKTDPPYYSLELNDDYCLPVITKKYGIEYYVKSLDEFNKKFPDGTSPRADIENEIINQFVQEVRVQCYYELWSHKIMSRAGITEFRMHACDKLESMEIHDEHGMYAYRGFGRRDLSTPLSNER